MAEMKDTPFPSSQKEEGQAFDATIKKGQPDGLFKACMVSIRSAHFRANKLRAALVMLGLFTDVSIYTHSLTMFYVVTREVERKLKDEKFIASLTQDEKEILEKLCSMGFEFTPGYEKDMQALYGKIYTNSNMSWQERVDRVIEETPVVKNYQKHIMEMTKATEVAGAVFVLWGAMIIGGGAMIQPKAKKLVGPDAVNVFASIIGPNRESRRKTFIETWDSLAPKSSLAAHEIQASTKQCMQYNNDLMGTGSKANPWWLKYALAPVALFSAGILYLLYDSWTPSSKKITYLTEL